MQGLEIKAPCICVLKMWGLGPAVVFCERIVIAGKMNRVEDFMFSGERLNEVPGRGCCFCSVAGLVSRYTMPQRPHQLKQKVPTNQGFWNPICLGRQNQNVGSLCLCGLWGPCNFKFCNYRSAILPCKRSVNFALSLSLFTSLSLPLSVLLCIYLHEQFRKLV